MLHPRTLQELPNGTFKSLMKPLKPDEVQQGALDVNGLMLEELMEAPSPEIVWDELKEFIWQFNRKKTSFWAPILCGYNSSSFDFPIISRYCKTYGPMDEKKGNQNLFSNFTTIDVMDFVYMYTENNAFIPDRKLTTVCKWLGLSTEGAHDALVDVRNTASILRKFMTFHRKLSENDRFEGAFSK